LQCPPGFAVGEGKGGYALSVEVIDAQVAAWRVFRKLEDEVVVGGIGIDTEKRRIRIFSYSGTVLHLHIFRGCPVGLSAVIDGFDGDGGGSLIVGVDVVGGLEAVAGNSPCLFRLDQPSVVLCIFYRSGSEKGEAVLDAEGVGSGRGGGGGGLVVVAVFEFDEPNMFI